MQPILNSKKSFVSTAQFLLSVTSQRDDDEPNRENEVGPIVGATLGSVLLLIMLVLFAFLGLAIVRRAQEKYAYIYTIYIYNMIPIYSVLTH